MSRFTYVTRKRGQLTVTVLKAKLRSLDLAWKQDPLPILQGPRQNENSGFLAPTVRVSTQDGRAFNHTQGPERLPTSIPKMPTLCVSVENALQVFERKMLDYCGSLERLAVGTF